MFLPQRRPAGAGGVGGLSKDERPPALRPWVEKYRPKTIEDVAAQEHTVAVLRKTLMSSNLPHMLFYGPPGTGKTSTILALARQLFGPELMRTRVLELNASDERGISVVREKIKTFAKLAVTNAVPGFPCPPYKIIILDEADSMTQDAQSALRRIMEQYSRITRFCLVCNYVTRIIEPLASRCSKFRFRVLDSGSTKERLKMIADSEGVEFEGGVLDTLITTSDGDLRRAITYLQSASRLHTFTATAGTDKTRITPASVIEIAGVVPPRVIRSLSKALGVPEDVDGDLDMAVDGDQQDDPAFDVDPGDTSGKQGSFGRVQGAVRSIAMQGFSGAQLLVQLHDYIIGNPLLSAKKKSKCALRFGEADKALVDGGDEELQILNLCLGIAADLSAK